MPEAGRTQDGVFTRSQARWAGWEDRRQRRLIRTGLWVPLAGTVLRHREVETGPWQLARAVHLTTGLVASHNTAGLLWQLEVPAELHGIGRVERRPRPVCTHRLDLTGQESLTVRGVAVTTPSRTLTDLMCSLGEEAGVAMLTDAFRRGLITVEDVRAAARRAHGRHGVTMARHLANSCKWEPHSPLEWHFHALIDSLGPGWRFNVDIHDDEGFVGRVDALHEPSGTIVELDGQRFHGNDHFQADRTRDQRLAALGYVVVRLTWDDVVNRPMDCVERVRRTVASRSRAGGPIASRHTQRIGRPAHDAPTGGNAGSDHPAA
jgi:hypothetical protein